METEGLTHWADILIIILYFGIVLGIGLMVSDNGLVWEGRGYGPSLVALRNQATMSDAYCRKVTQSDWVVISLRRSRGGRAGGPEPPSLKITKM